VEQKVACEIHPDVLDPAQADDRRAIGLAIGR
jgi:hypothetical protein